MRRFFILCLMLGLVGALQVGWAQQPLTQEERLWVNYVSSAYTNLKISDSVRVAGDVEGGQDLFSGTGPLRDEATFLVEFNYEAELVPSTQPNGGQFSINMEQVVDATGLDGGDQRIDASLAGIYTDGQLYSVYSAKQPEAVAGLPEGWFLWEDYLGPVTTIDVPIDEMFVSPFNFLYEVNLDSVLSIRETAPEVIGGENARVFQIMLDPDYLAAQQLVTKTSIGEGTPFFLTATFGDLPDSAIVNNMVYEMTVRIRQSDQRPLSMEFVWTNLVDANNGEGGADQRLSGVISYSDYDAPVSIVAPDGSGAVAEEPKDADSNQLGQGESAVLAPLQGDAAVTRLQAAYQNLETLSGYRITGEIIGDQLLIFTGGGGRDEIIQDIQFNFGGLVQPNPAGSDAFDIVISQDQYISDPSGEQTLVVDTGILSLGEGSLYANFDFIDEAVPGQANQVPAGWFEWEPVLGPPSQVDVPWDKPITELFLYYYLLNPQSVASVTPVDNPNAEQYEVVLDIDYLTSQNVMDKLGLGDGTPVYVVASFQGISYEAINANRSYQMVITVQEFDGVVLPVEVSYTFQNQIDASPIGTSDQLIEGRVRYSEFNTPVNITGPALGQ